jgi:hypothetical protein
MIAVVVEHRVLGMAPPDHNGGSASRCRLRRQSSDSAAIWQLVRHGLLDQSKARMRSPISPAATEEGLGIGRAMTRRAHVFELRLAGSGRCVGHFGDSTEDLSLRAWRGCAI